MTTPSERDRSQLALRARHGQSEIAFEARERFAIGAVVVLVVVVASIVLAMLAIS